MENLLGFKVVLVGSNDSMILVYDVSVTMIKVVTIKPLSNSSNACSEEIFLTR